MQTTKILLVDEVDSHLERGREALSSSGAIILTASGETEALGLLKKDRPDIVLSAAFTSAINGENLCKTIKTDSALKDLPVILLTDSPEQTNSVRQRLGPMCDAVLERSYKRRDIMDLVYRHVSISRRRHERKPIKYKINYTHEKETLSGEVVDISLGGLLIKSANPLPVGSKISFLSYTDKNNGSSPASGEVVRTDNQHMGVLFLNTAI